MNKIVIDYKVLYKELQTCIQLSISVLYHIKMEIEITFFLSLAQAKEFCKKFVV